jgi:hypothetical protein
MAKPKRGLKTFKGSGSRLLRDLPDNDWINVQSHEGIEDWKNGLLFTRHYAYQEKNGGRQGQHLYRLEALRHEGLEQVALAYGKTSDDAWDLLFESLKRKGVMPQGAIE